MEDTTAQHKTQARTKRTLKKGEYIEAVGRRKTAVARVRLIEGGKMSYIVNRQGAFGVLPDQGPAGYRNGSARQVGVSRKIFDLGAAFRGRFGRAGRSGAPRHKPRTC